MTKAKILILLSLSLVIQSLSSVFIKFAGQYETLSREFIIFYVLAIGCLGILLAPEAEYPVDRG